MPGTTTTSSSLLDSKRSSRCLRLKNLPPEDMSFAKSDALFPPEDLAKKVSAEYEGQCKLLCYGPYPSWQEVQDKLLALRELL